MDVLDLESWEEQSMTLESWEGQSMTLVKHQQQMQVQNSWYLTISWCFWSHRQSWGPWSFSQFPLISPEPYCQKRRIKHCSSHSHYILIDQLKKDFLVLHIELCMNPAHNMLPVNFLIDPKQNGILGLGLLQWELAGRIGQLKGEQNNTALVVSFMLFTIISQWGNHTIRTTTKNYKLQGSHTHNTIIMTRRLGDPSVFKGPLGGLVSCKVYL